jgi:hypothetical protein
MSAKRKKDPEYQRLRDVLEEFLDVAEAYRARLEAELESVRAEPDPYVHLIRPLERQIDSLRKLETHMDDQVWPRLIELANVSAYIEHARTRDYF